MVYGPLRVSNQPPLTPKPRPPSQARVLAQLNHPYIIKHYDSWIGEQCHIYTVCMIRGNWMMSSAHIHAVCMIRWGSARGQEGPAHPPDSWISGTHVWVDLPSL